jgi:hypothetical protein
LRRHVSLRRQRAEIKRGWFACFAATQAHLASTFSEPVEIPRMRHGHGACSACTQRQRREQGD